MTHPFVPDAYGDCAAGCGLPRANRCHVSVRVQQQEHAPAMTPLAAIQPVTGHAHPGTSSAAAASLPGDGTIPHIVLSSIWAAGEHGRTDDEMEAETNMAHQTVSASRNRLVAHGWLIAMMNGGERVTRPTRSGRAATVWRLTDAARREFEKQRSAR